MKFLAVQCFSCRAMQVKQAKKASNKWSCSICNEKQSLRKVFLSSDAAKDVRTFVQQANLARGLSEEATTLADVSDPFNMEENALDGREAVQEPPNGKQHLKHHKWERFLPHEAGSDGEDVADPEDAKYVTSVPDPRSRKSQSRGAPSKPWTGTSSTLRARSPQRCADNVTEEPREMKERGMQAAFPKSKHVGVRSGKDSELSRENSYSCPSSKSSRNVSAQPGSAHWEYPEGPLKRGYAFLVGECSQEISKVSKRAVPVYQSSKWSKYIEHDDS